MQSASFASLEVCVPASTNTTGQRVQVLGMAQLSAFKLSELCASWSSGIGVSESGSSQTLQYLVPVPFSVHVGAM